MQLLQKLRSSSNLEQLESEIARFEVEARGLSTTLIDFLSKEPHKTLLYAYTGFGSIPAHISYWFSLAMSPRPLVAVDAEDASLYILPYRDDVSMIIYSTGEYSKLISSVQVAKLLGVEYRAFAPLPSDERLRFLVKHYSINTFDAKNSYEAALVLSIASFFAHSNLYKGCLQARGRRLFKHGEEGFTIITRSLVEKYAPVIEKIANLEKLYISSTKLLESSAQMFAQVLTECGIVATYVSQSGLTSVRDPILVVYTSTEDRAIKELKVARKLGLVELVFNTDPLEANVYLTILAYALYKLGKQ